MLSILSGILGFATSGLPSVLKFFEQKGDNAHEEAMAKLALAKADSFRKFLLLMFFLMAQYFFSLAN